MRQLFSGISSGQVQSRARRNGWRAAFFALAMAVVRCVSPGPGHGAEPLDPVLNLLLEKGVVTEEEVAKARAQAEAIRTNAAAPLPPVESKWKLGNAFKNIELFGDIRLRYEYRAADNYPDITGDPNSTYMRERFRYSLRIGLRGDLYDDFYYGLRLETGSNPRSSWVTFGGDTVTQNNTTPSSKSDDGVFVGQAYLGWRPTSWLDLTVGKMPNPLYTTSMVWDGDINPEGAAERFKFTVGDFDLFATFGQFVYQDTNPDSQLPSSDTFLLAWQLGAQARLTKDISVKFAPTLYNYIGQGQTNANNLLFGPGQYYTGEGVLGQNGNAIIQGLPANESAINDLLVLEIPAELNFKIGRKYNAKLFGDFACNIYGDRRARNAASAFPPTTVVDVNGAQHLVGLSHPYTGQDKAWQFGVSFGNPGLVYGQTSKKNTFEVRTYWQHVEQYALDVNLMDSDFFEGRANLEGIFAAAAYSISDGIIAAVRYGHARPINSALGTGGSNQDLPILNPINNYNLLQLDLTYRF